MFISYEQFQHRADMVRARIAEACARSARDPAAVELLAVTKTHPPEAADYAARYGLRSVGENRVQEAVEKQAQTRAQVRWELIGHLQSNKAALAARHFGRIQSVDSEKLVRVLDAEAAQLGRRLPILLQINAGDDPAKFGAAPEDGPRLLESALARANLVVEGLMTIAPLSSDPEVARRACARLRGLRDRWSAQFGVELKELSMGMTGDLEAAISEGSTIVRVGTALFGERGKDYAD